MKKRPFSKSLAGKFVVRTVLITLIVALAAGLLASTSMILALAVAVVGTVAAGFMAMQFANQVIEPLDSLRGAAAQSAALLPAVAAATANGEALPDLPRIQMDSGDEIEDVATSFNQMQRAAAEIAATPLPEVPEIDVDALEVERQRTTDRFVNLGRRSQNLLARQMSFIDEMEKDERNPANLQRLFQIDHLATRMRRNAESILVLADETSPRRLRRSVSMHQVVQAASSEIEYFDRIAIADISGASVDGAAATDIAHLLAELLENATSFSSPEATTTVSGRRTDQGYLLEIADRGIGMTPEAMAAANARFADPTGELDAQHSSSFLGHDVVSRLARRHRVAIELTETVAGGVTARLHIPNSALAAEAPAPEPVQVAPQTPSQPTMAPETMAPEPLAPSNPPQTAGLTTAAAGAAATAFATPTVDAPLANAPLVEAPSQNGHAAPAPAAEYSSPQSDTAFADLVPQDASALAPSSAAGIPAPTASAPVMDEPAARPAPAPVAKADPVVTPAAEPSVLDDGWVERGLTPEQLAAIDWAISKGGSVSAASRSAGGLAGVAAADAVRPGPIDAATVAELGATTPSGFKRRRVGEEGSAVFSDPSQQAKPRVPTTPRSPDQLMAFRKGIETGRAQAAAAASTESTNNTGDL